VTFKIKDLTLSAFKIKDLTLSAKDLTLSATVSKLNK